MPILWICAAVAFGFGLYDLIQGSFFLGGLLCLLGVIMILLIRDLRRPE